MFPQPLLLVVGPLDCLLGGSFYILLRCPCMPGVVRSPREDGP